MNKTLAKILIGAFYVTTVVGLTITLCALTIVGQGDLSELQHKLVFLMWIITWALCIMLAFSTIYARSIIE